MLGLLLAVICVAVICGPLAWWQERREIKWILERQPRSQVPSRRGRNLS